MSVKKSGYQLTEAGIQLKQTAITMEREVLNVEANLSGMQDELTGELKISAINNMASSILMPIFASFSKKHPKITLHLMVTNKNISLAEREADVVIRLTNTPLETLIGKRLATVSSAPFASRDYLEQLNQQTVEETWLGVTCCGFHQSWTKQAQPQEQHNVYSDDTLLTKSAIINGLGIAYLPCFMGDDEALLQRFKQPDPSHDLGLWLLFHPDMKHNAKILAFRRHFIQQTQMISHRFEGRSA
ncbi:MAG: LysR family transcriptional regulator [Enterobacterales bacterium]|nr:LysR family transcriptional regulator [Enterobacterales bacterium]